MCFRELDKNRKVKVKLEHHMHILWVQFHPAACLFLTLSALSPPSPILFSSLSPFLLVSACHPFPFFFLLLFLFFFSPPLILSFVSTTSLSRTRRKKDGIYRSRYTWFVYIPCSTGPASFIRRFLFTVYAMVNLRGRWNDKATWPVSP